jgi:AraC-like DNA-binding protein
VLLFMRVSGTARLVQHGRSCTLRSGDWCLANTVEPLECWELGACGEYFVLTLEPPSDAELRELFEQGMARAFQTKAGLSRILQANLVETFKEMNSLNYASGRSLQRVLTTMTWDALHEQLETPQPLRYSDLQCSRIKSTIDQQLTDPELDVDAIARACGMSVRSVHRAFAAHPAGTVSAYVWQRRLNRCAADLRDAGQAHRPITDICMSWGFNSTSHFSRLFKAEFGVSPREYRMASESASVPPAYF